jgi:plastocyanin
MTPGATLIYPSVNIIPSPSKLEGQAALNIGIGDELVTLNATVPSGISLRFFGSNLTNVIYQEIGAGPLTSVELQLIAAPGIPTGNYPVMIEGSSGTLSVNYTFTVQMVPYLITAQYGRFSPVSLTVPVGSTVYWINVDPDPAADYNVIFNTPNVQSNALNPCPACDVFSYTFTTAGVYPYYDTAGAEVGMKGTITVTG